MEDSILEDYKNGFTQLQIYEKYKIGRRKLKDIFQRNNITPRKGIPKTGQTIPCKACNTLIYLPNYRVKENNFCSRDCYDEFHQCAWEQKCKCCGKIFTTTRKTNLYCSRKCYKLDYEPLNYYKGSKQGNIKLSKCNNIIHYDSSYELRRLFQYELDKTVVKFERCIDKIGYTYEDKFHYYHPDYKVFYEDKIVVEEIKGYIGQLEIVKFIAGKEFYKKQGIEYKVVTVNTLNSFDIINPLMNIKQTDDFIYTWADKIYTHLSCLKLYAEMSKCIRTKVACFIYDAELFFNDDVGTDIILGQGINTGICKSLEGGKCGCIHAEQNAFDNFYTSQLHDKFKNSKKVVLLTLSPCFNCAKILLENNVTHVYYVESYRDVSGITFLRKNGVACIGYRDYFNAKIKEFGEAKTI